MSTLELKNLSLSYDKTNVLKNINLSINSGEFMILVGPSGSGKSTILRAVAGLETPTEGEIILDDKVINNYHPKDRDIAMVFQNYALYPHLTVYENIAFPLKMKKVDEKTINSSVSEAAELLGVDKYLSKRPKELSGGERQRVALGRAIVRKPKLFLMDEPLSNLDAKLRSQMRTELLSLHKTLSATFIYVTHDQTEALTMGDKIAVLNLGEIQQIDTPKKIYDNPKNVFVGGFIGSPPMNFFDFEVDSESSFYFMGDHYSDGLPSDFYNLISGKGLLNKKLLLGVRPEDIGDNNSKFKFTAEIELIEMLGFENIIHFSLKDKRFIARNRAAVAEGPHEFSLDFSKSLIYCAESGFLVEA